MPMSMPRRAAAVVAVAALTSTIAFTAPRQARPRGAARTPATQSTVLHAERGPATANEPARSKRNANYSIDVELDPSSRTLVGREVLTWRNITSRPASELQFHLYYNAWSNTRSTWLRESVLAGRTLHLDRMRPSDWGWIDITAMRLLAAAPAPFTDLLAGRRFIAPDDGNSDDRTVMSVQLPRPVAPGESIAVEIAWTSHVPYPFARTGAIGRFFFLGQWFPKIGVLQENGWNTHQFHLSTEFFSDYGSYDVRITVPSEWIVGATGMEQPRLDMPNGKTTHRFVQDDVHDFAWTASPDFVEHRARFEHSGLPPVTLRLLLQREHAGQEEAHFDAARNTLLYYGRWFGPYPYAQLTIVDPAYQSEADGMEYPTLFTAGTNWLVGAGGTEPQGVTVHEAGHQFWYGLVGTNEFEHAWMDEGLNTFSTGRLMAQRYPGRPLVERYFGDFVPWVYRDIVPDRIVSGDRINTYRPDAKTDLPSTPSWRYFPATGRHITYDKTALWLHTLENLIGWPRLQRGMSAFLTRYTYEHPTPQDFFATLSSGAGTDLTWYFDQVYRSTGVLDYGVQSFTTRRAGVNGYVPRDGGRDYVRGGTDEPLRYVTELVVRRRGEMSLPVDIAVTFADGQRVHERWDGREPWHMYRWERPAAGVTAQIDPERVLVLDVNYTNNSWTLQPAAAGAARKWSVKWLVWLQDAVLTWASLV